jgi:hypothetical protein
MKRVSVVTLFLAVAFLATSHAEARTKKKKTEREPSSEQKFCGTWIHGEHSYVENYSHFKPTTLLGTVKDNKFNLQVLARAQGGRWDIIKDIGHLECICLKGQRDGNFLASVTGVFECNGGPERHAKPDSDGESTKFVPKNLVHSNGKAFTECQDPAEQQQDFQGRQICVNAQGDYYFIAD